ncbi:MAG: hypothetical protein GY711_31805 [bacterium]|nr:hypothetical protein [bacterium]
MQKDFHYYATYMAARATGIAIERSRRLAEWSEVIDEAFNGLVPRPTQDEGTQWVAAPWAPTVDGIKSGKVHRTVTSTKVSRLGPSVRLGTVGHDAIPWIAYHFLPGLSGKGGKKNPYAFDVASRLRILEAWHAKARFGGAESRSQIDQLLEVYKENGAPKSKVPGQWELLQQLICWPNSATAKALVADTEGCARALAEGSAPVDCIRESGVEDVVENAVLLDESIGDLGLGRLSADGFLEALVGSRMHVYVDTWAHQGFMGADVPAVNATDAVRGSHDGVPRPDYEVLLHSSSFAKALRDVVNLGHAQVDSFADHPALDFTWHRVWDDRTFERNNPREFAAAYRAMYGLFSRAGKHVGWNKRKLRVDAWHPDEIDETFFRSLVMLDSGGDFAVEKNYRCDQLLARIHEQDGKALLPTEGTDADFGIIRHVYVTRRVDLAYYSLATLYHQKWVEKRIAEAFGGSRFDKQIERLARDAGLADENIRESSLAAKAP